ncbi:MAG: hypothetical protein LBK58_14915 [Prevotellaceae bacterium]|jgi:hypothetical protein|nr:hypothetical protein [Prevotellaceae bacterium]
MEMNKTDREFDCIAMKNDIQAKIYTETKDMDFQELRAYMDKTLQSDTFWQRIQNRCNYMSQYCSENNTYLYALNLEDVAE